MQLNSLRNFLRYRIFIAESKTNQKMDINPLSNIVAPMPQKNLLMEVPLNNVTAGATNKFPQVNMLRGVKIVAIEAFASDILSAAPSGRQEVSPEDMAKLTVTIQNTPFQKRGKSIANQEMVAEYPCIALAPNITGGVLRYFDEFPIDFEKSFIKVNSAGISANKSICLSIWYN